MTHIECEFEAEALAAALQSRWPENVDDELRTHVEACPICSDVVTLALAFDEAREDSKDLGKRSRCRPGLEVSAGARSLRGSRQGHDAHPHHADDRLRIRIRHRRSLLWSIIRLAAIDAHYTMDAFSGEHVRGLVAFAAQHGFLLAGAAILIVLVPTAAWLTASGE